MPRVLASAYDSQSRCSIGLPFRPGATRFIQYSDISSRRDESANLRGA
jgi:hypothetical protein